MDITTSSLTEDPIIENQTIDPLLNNQPDFKICFEDFFCLYFLQSPELFHGSDAQRINNGLLGWKTRKHSYQQVLQNKNIFEIKEESFKYAKKSTLSFGTSGSGVNGSNLTTAAISTSLDNAGTLWLPKSSSLPLAHHLTMLEQCTSSLPNYLSLSSSVIHRHKMSTSLDNASTLSLPTSPSLPSSVIHYPQICTSLDSAGTLSLPQLSVLSSSPSTSSSPSPKS